MDTTENDDVRMRVRDLVARYRRGDLSLEDFEYRLESLLGQLSGVDRDQDRALRGIVNALEVIRFTHLPESQLQAVDASMMQLERIMAELP
ncbi:hypothetical protein [Actinacidiphila guanduensis]|uniref:Uncharacterized protein n=1 Tax=Actinacidiphila guanduensis TaxID=310781 RepID=A0A1G9WF96_9ACTN|nr:hypothetical protein [Actinacidiphila guanduensis]SDM82977.1 hypothetical protein SAMN05216259_101624 [Actinacidiphila guanduensis]